MYLRTITTCLLAAFLLLLMLPGFAHDGKKHPPKTRKPTAQEQPPAPQSMLSPVTDSGAAPHRHPADAPHHPVSGVGERPVHASVSDFPNMHPLIVHFPIMLLLVAAVVQLLNVIFLSGHLSWVTTTCTLVGFGTAYVAARFAHPHTTGLTGHAQLVLDQHDLYADWTLYLGGTGLVAQLASQFVFKNKRWSVLAVALVLSASAYAVTMAGHYGAQLVHIEGVGPQGRHLDTGHRH